MASKIRNVKAIQRKINKKIQDFKRSNKEMNKAALIIRNDIMENSRNGLGHDGKPYPSISTAWKNKRAKLAENVTTHSKFNAGSLMSNITFSGEFLKSLLSIGSKGKITLSMDGDHKSYSKSKSVGNSVILKGLQDKGYKILGVSKTAKERINKQFLKFMRRRKN